MIARYTPSNRRNVWSYGVSKASELKHSPVLLVRDAASSRVELDETMARIVRGAEGGHE